MTNLGLDVNSLHPGLEGNHVKQLPPYEHQNNEWRLPPSILFLRQMKQGHWILTDPPIAGDPRGSLHVHSKTLIIKCWRSNAYFQCRSKCPVEVTVNLEKEVSWPRTRKELSSHVTQLTAMEINPNIEPLHACISCCKQQRLVIKERKIMSHQCTN